MLKEMERMIDCQVKLTHVIMLKNFIDPDTYKHFLIMNGQKIEIYKSAKKSIYVVDNYI